MSNALTVITQQLTSKDVKNQIALALDLRPEDEDGQREAYKYASNVIAEIAKTQGDQYGDLTKCSPDSICRAVIDAAQFKVQIDGRKFAHLESRWNKTRQCNEATLQIDTNGFVAKIKEAHPDADFKIQPVYKGDKVQIVTDGGLQTFTYKSNNAFGKMSELEGIIVQIRYKSGERLVSTVDTISIEELNVIKSKGKGAAWKDFPLERMKTAALKRAAKWHFRQNALLQEMIDYDNKQFDLTQQPDASATRPTIIDQINDSVKEPPAADDVIDAESEVIDDGSHENDSDNKDLSDDAETQTPEKNEELEDAGNQAASEGVAAYTEWRDALSDDEKEYIRLHDLNKKWSKIAKENDPA